ncbi:hypothetical protein IE53DRAFT_360813 [Violaceomyces palustris]|uniref:Uncharacterized protein n=1 Tax=Violaceomyces palustris TaxID=1673888 RepID=A0ACD0P330_9BASI|nr:hypothetical protein IE53DRAFT_360813 [Violaceomyces palustris]
MLKRCTSLALPALLLSAWAPGLADAFTIVLTTVSCSQLVFDLTLTPNEFATATDLSVRLAGEEVTQVGFSGSYSATRLTAAFAAPFYAGTEITTGTSSLTFVLLDEDGEDLPGAIVRSVTFNCQATATPVAVTTTSDGVVSTTTSTPPPGTSGTGTINDQGGSSSTNSSSSSSSSSNTGAIAGGVVGGVVVLAALGLLAFCLKKRRNRDGRTLVGAHDLDNHGADARNDSTTSLATAPESSPFMTSVSNAPVSNTTQDIRGAAALGGATATLATQNGNESAANPGSSSSPVLGSKQQNQSSISVHDAATNQDQNSNGPNRHLAAQGAGIAGAAAAAAAVASTVGNRSNNASKEQVNTSASTTTVPTTSHPSGGASTPEHRSSPTVPDAKPLEAPSSPPPAALVTPSASRAPVATATPLYSSQTPQQSSEAIANTGSSKRPPPPPPPSSSAAGNQAVSPGGKTRASAFQSPPGRRPGSRGMVASESSISQAGYGNVPSLPPTSAAASELGQAAADEDFSPGIAGFGARAAGGGMSSPSPSTNSTKWHQQRYNVMPNYSSRPLTRSQLFDEDVIFGGAPVAAALGSASASGSGSPYAIAAAASPAVSESGSVRGGRGWGPRQSVKDTDPFANPSPGEQ